MSHLRRAPVVVALSVALLPALVRGAAAQTASSVLDGPPPAAGPEPLWVPDPEQTTESAGDAQALDSQATATIAPDPALTGDAARVANAHWMATTARAAGLPGELPVMAAIVESGLRNIPYGDADSVGFFQMRLSIWDNGPYAGYLTRPELQLQWFIDHAIALRDSRRAAGDAHFGEDPAGWGEWIADVERPYAAYRGRYQLHLDEARALLALPADTVSPLEVGLTVGGPAAAPAVDPTGDPLAKRVLADPRITLDPRARSDLETAGTVDPRVSANLLEAAKLYPISVWVIKTGHSYYTAGGSVSNHSFGRAVDIGTVDGVPVSPTNEKAKEMALALGRLPLAIRSTEIGSPWLPAGPEYFTDGDHQDHLHVGFDDPPAADNGAVAVALVSGGDLSTALPASPKAAASARAEPRFEAGEAAPARAKRTKGSPRSGAASAEPRFDVGR